MQKKKKQTQNSAYKKRKSRLFERVSNLAMHKEKQIALQKRIEKKRRSNSHKNKVVVWFKRDWFEESCFKNVWNQKNRANFVLSFSFWNRTETQQGKVPSNKRKRKLKRSKPSKQQEKVRSPKESIFVWANFWFLFLYFYCRHRNNCWRKNERKSRDTHVWSTRRSWGAGRRQCTHRRFKCPQEARSSGSPWVEGSGQASRCWCAWQQQSGSRFGNGIVWRARRRRRAGETARRAGECARRRWGAVSNSMRAPRWARKQRHGPAKCRDGIGCMRDITWTSWCGFVRMSVRSESSKDQQEERRAMLLLKSQALLNMREPRRTEWCRSPSDLWTMPRRDAELKRRKTKRRAERAARRKRPHVPAGGKDGWKDLMLMKEESTEEEEEVNFEDPNRPQEREARRRRSQRYFTRCT